MSVKKKVETVKLLPETQREIRKSMRDLHNSCVEGITGEWDCSRDGFEAMIEQLDRVHELLGIPWLPSRKFDHLPD